MAADGGQGDDSVRVAPVIEHRLLPYGYLNGHFARTTEFRISPLDRGFLFGDAITETLLAVGLRPFALNAHLDSLGQALTRLGLEDPYPPEQWASMLANMLETNDKNLCHVHIAISRGPGSLSRSVVTPRRQTVLLYCTAPNDELGKPVTGWIVDERRGSLERVGNAKLWMELLARHEAQTHGADECLFVADGGVTEGAGAHVFAVLDDFVVTPPLGPSVSDGIYRTLVREVVESMGLAIVEAEISQARLDDASEVWLVGALHAIRPVVRLNDRAIGRGEPGPVWRKAQARFDELTGAPAA
ncbi:MAG: aminotransferase class IV [Pseudomonadota bacterium]